MNNEDLIELFSKLKDKTCEIIKIVQEEEYDKINILMGERAKIIEDIALLHCGKSELKVVFNKFDISQLEEELSKYINEKETKVKLELGKVIRSENAGKNYNSYFQKKAVIFSKKV